MFRTPTYAGNLDEYPARFCFEGFYFLSRQTQHRLEQRNLRIANRELRGVDSYRNAPRARVTVVSRQRHLTPFIQLPMGSKRQRVCGDRDSCPQNLLNRGI